MYYYFHFPAFLLQLQQTNIISMVPINATLLVNDIWLILLIVWYWSIVQLLGSTVLLHLIISYFSLKIFVNFEYIWFSKFIVNNIIDSEHLWNFKYAVSKLTNWASIKCIRNERYPDAVIAGKLIGWQFEESCNQIISYHCLLSVHMT